MSRRGAKGEVRPAFSVEEIAQLRLFMTSWQKLGNLDYDRVMRPLLAIESVTRRSSAAVSVFACFISVLLK